MAYSATLNVTKATWTMVTNALTSAVCLQNQSGHHAIFVKATTNTTAPTTTDGAIRILPNQIVPADLTLAQLFPGIVTTTGHIWVLNNDIDCTISIGHA